MGWKLFTVLVLAFLTAARGEELERVAIGELTILGLRNGSEVVGRVVEVGEKYVHVVSGGFNRRIPLEALDEGSRERLGVLGTAAGGVQVEPLRPGELDGLTATRERLREALERQEAWGWGRRRVGGWAYGYWGWGPYVLWGGPVVAPVPWYGWHGSSIQIQVGF
jgi:hypothetical protein